MAADVARKSASKHFKVYQADPIPGNYITMIDLQTYHVTTHVLAGPYKGLHIHWVLTIPNSYPYTPPMGTVAPQFYFTNAHHHHVYSFGFCNDFLGNVAGMNASAGKGQGWTPAADFRSLMLVMQDFFEDPDFPRGHLLSPESITDVVRRNAQYVCPVHEECGYTFQQISEWEVAEATANLVVAPKKADRTVDTKPSTVDTKSSTAEAERLIATVQLPTEAAETKAVETAGAEAAVAKAAEAAETKAAELRRAREARIRRELFCCITKEHHDDANTILGYPVYLEHQRNGKLNTTLIPEFMSYDAYMHGRQAMLSGVGNAMRTATGAQYNYWMPLYINATHFTRALPYVETALAVLARGERGTTENDFQPAMVLQVLPALMNQEVVAMMNGQTHHSDAAILAYGMLLQIFLHLVQRYPTLLPECVQMLYHFKKDTKDRHKRRAGDLGELFVKMALVSRTRPDLSYKNPDMQKAIVGELLARQIFWIRKADAGALSINPPSLNKTKGAEQLQRINDDAQLQRIYQAAKVSNGLFVFNLEATNFFMVPNIEAHLEMECGLIPPAKLLEFQERIKRIKAINSYAVFRDAIQMTKAFPTAVSWLQAFQEAIKMALKQGYI